MTKELPDPQTLRNLLRYDPEAGFIFRKSDGARVMKTPHIKGYFCGVVLRRKMLSHRVAWAMHHGSWPEGEVDHINGDKHDNRIANLRDVPRCINARNAKMYLHNKSGHNGVSWSKDKNMWTAQITINWKNRNLGSYSDINDAIAARKAAERGHGFTERHGQCKTAYISQ